MADDTTAESIIRELPLLPVLGFVLALCYEGAFFFSLGIELRQILTLTDIVEASALKILPLIPMLFIGAWVGSSDPLPRAENNRQRARNFFHNGPYHLIKYTIYFSAGMYLLFGVAPEIGFISLALVITLSVGRIAIFPALLDTRRETGAAVWFFILITVIFVSMGQSDAHTIRFGDRSKLPLVTTETMAQDAYPDGLRLVRRLSSGVLVATKTENRLWFIHNDSSSILTFEIDPTPFRGIVCGGFGWCPNFLDVSATYPTQ